MAHKIDNDTALAAKYGRYASFASNADPTVEDHFGDSHEDEVRRLLGKLITPHSKVLDLGCGAGQRTCELASSAGEMWGFDGNEELLSAAKERSVVAGLTNTRFVSGDTSDCDAVAQLPDNYFDLVYTVRGPFLNTAMMPKLTSNGVCVVELYQDALGLKEIFGRKPFLPTQTFAAADFCVSHHSDLGFLPVSVKDYYFDQFFRDEDHLATQLSHGMTLSNWWMEPRPYDDTRDRHALGLYARYNGSSRGIRVTSHRKIYLFRRATTNYYPADARPID